jgi:cathepsin A (carboxypeptidase C)
MRTALVATALALLLAASAPTVTGMKATLRATGSGWPACDPAVTQRSGYMDISDVTDKHYFFWMFEAKTNPTTAPLILWMTGGPGCSSGLAVLIENGPCHMNETTGDLYTNPYSWNNVANIIYIDQPAGVGFSYTNSTSGYDYNETMVADDMYTFMQAFYTAYPQYQANPLFVYGESYGGHFAPATAHRLWQGNQNGTGIKVPLTGLSVGNGLTDPAVQFNWYSKLSYDWCIQTLGTPCVDESTYQSMQQALPTCMALIASCNAGEGGCSDAMDYCSGTQMQPYQDTGLNVYDIRKQCIGPLCYDLSQVSVFFNRADVQASLGVANESITWHTCSDTVNGMFQSDWMRDFNQTVPDLLNSGIRVLIYAGDMDFICNWLGNKAWTLGLEWSGRAGYRAALDLPWWLEQQPAGRFRSVAGNNNNMLFTFIQIHDAGHMVPMDQPARALSVVTHFLADQPFYGYAGPLPSNTPSPSPTSQAPDTTQAPATTAAPTSSSPASNTFTQMLCPTSACTGCQSHAFSLGQCLGLQNGDTAIATCTATELVLTVFTSNDCTGAGTPSSEPLNQCLSDGQGSFVENICASSSAAPHRESMFRRSKLLQ